MALPAHVYQSEAWQSLAQHLRAEIDRLHLALEAHGDQDRTNRLRGEVALARRLLQDAQPSAILPALPPVDY